MMFTKADRNLLYSVHTYQFAQRDMWIEWNKTIAAQLRALSDGQDKLMQSHAALAQRFEDIGGFIETRVKPLTDDEKFEWAKNIIFGRGYVIVKMEDARQALQGQHPAKKKKG